MAKELYTSLPSLSERRPIPAKPAPSVKEEPIYVSLPSISSRMPVPKIPEPRAKLPEL